MNDLCAAILAALDNPAAARRLFNISMNEPVDYGQLAALMKRKHGLDSVTIPTPYHSNWLDNAGARLALDWRRETDLEALAEQAWAYRRGPDDPRKVWLPGRQTGPLIRRQIKGRTEIAA